MIHTFLLDALTLLVTIIYGNIMIMYARSSVLLGMVVLYYAAVLIRRTVRFVVRFSVPCVS